MNTAHATDYALRSLWQIDAAAIARLALGDRVLAVETHDPRTVALSRDPDGVALVRFEDGPACALFVEFETDARAELARQMAVTTMLPHGKVGQPVCGVALLVAPRQRLRRNTALRHAPLAHGDEWRAALR